MTVVWIVIGLVVVVAALLVVLEVQNARRRKALAHLEPVDPRVGERAMSEASGEHAIIEGVAKSAHPGISGAGGGPLG
ncbi:MULTISPECIES: hypothetical protein [unclassified Curtobacterium]|jgi:hypothetical protein|uniref:hypothetical protein n=1 Tax=unclassified Curtobacterium TaxID=257496 RepID=UPI00052AAD07|nr:MULTISPECIES: hypothetical protein [unclassified Curtobacterium]AIV41172.1 hypothetical protein NI26_15725 [Curtobacterium sp. MR_MD2014]MBP1301922.1 beta-lactamase regulating signal transducer with metallopeptidase domain [Curtobacterium sp. 1310]MCM3506362.1 hypothetical protein [Curtobacterium sp. ODYSSEY 48 V2]MCM3523187.1 hypothetical protein [Curtobacterium sp. P97]MDB6426151.1 hypothetical protein [Curtobacterium sp. 20TX0008]